METYPRYKSGLTLCAHLLAGWQCGRIPHPTPLTSSTDTALGKRADLHIYLTSPFSTILTRCLPKAHCANFSADAYSVVNCRSNFTRRWWLSYADGEVSEWPHLHWSVYSHLPTMDAAQLHPSHRIPVPFSLQGNQSLLQGLRECERCKADYPLRLPQMITAHLAMATDGGGPNSQSIYLVCCTHCWVAR